MPRGNRLSKMRVEEISLVTKPANQESNIVFFKSAESDTATGNLKERNTVPSSTNQGVAMPLKPQDLLKGIDLDGLSEESRAAIMDTMSKLHHDNSVLVKAIEKMASDDDDDDPRDYDDPDEGKRSGSAPDLDDGEDPHVFRDEDLDDDGFDEDDANQQGRKGQHNDSDVEKLLKSADPQIANAMRRMIAKSNRAEAIAKAERNRRLDGEFIAKAAGFTHLTIDPSTFGPILRKMADSLDVDSLAEIDRVLTAANEAVEMAKLTSEVGNEGSRVSKAVEAVDAKVAALRKSDPSLTKEQALMQVVTSDPDLYRQYQSEKKG